MKSWQLVFFIVPFLLQGAFTENIHNKFRSDRLILVGGEELVGEISSLPSIQLSCGELSLSKQQLLSLFNRGGQWSWITHQGGEICSKAPMGSVIFSDGRRVEFQKIKAIHFASSELSPGKAPLFQVTLTTGEKITGSVEKRTFRLPFFERPGLNVAIAEGASLNLPWSSVISIERFEAPAAIEYKEIAFIETVHKPGLSSFEDRRLVAFSEGAEVEKIMLKQRIKELENQLAEMKRHLQMENGRMGIAH